MFTRRICIAWMSCVVVCGTAWAERPVHKKASSQPVVSRKLAIIQQLQSSMVQVAYTLQYDKGESPSIGGWRVNNRMIPSCLMPSDGEVIKEERAYETPGFVLSPTLIVAPDINVHTRFIKNITVRCNGQKIPAHISAYAVDQNAVFLTLDKPLQNVTPLVFHPEAKGPYWAVAYDRVNGEWTIRLEGFSPALSVTQQGRKYLSPPRGGNLIVNRKGLPVALVLKDEMPADASWKGSPQDWSQMSAQQMQDDLKHLEDVFAQSLVRVTLQFRSPKKGSPDADEYSYRYGRGDDSEGAGTERNVMGVVLEDGRVLVLASLPPKLTARLESIRVNPTKGGDPVPATFQASLKDYGAFIAKMDAPPSDTFAPLSFTNANILSYRYQLLLSVEVEIQGDKMTTYFGHNRITGYDVGWKDKLFPESKGSKAMPLFDCQGKLVALPIIRRAKLAVKDSWDDEEPILTPAKHLGVVLNASPETFAKRCSPDNVPLSEEEENRLAWFGVELQGLTPQLARMKKISHLTRDGSFGGMVSYLYPGSPAEKAGVQVGDILIQLHVPGQPKPIEIGMNDSYMFSDNTFPWDQLDNIPEQYFDEIPMPWPSAENVLNRTLTDLGFGKKFKVELVRDGKTMKLGSTVVQSPAHYGSAKSFKSEPLKLTVKNLTYEVQRYFRRKPEQEGVIVSKIEPGGPAAVSGIRPYEIITHINDQPVYSIEDFQKYAAQPGELLMTVKRMNKGRVVKIKKRSATTQPTTQPTSAPASQPASAPAATQPAGVN